MKHVNVNFAESTEPAIQLRDDRNGISQTIAVPGVAHPFAQAYTYDELNRLTNAEEMKNSVQQWEQRYTFDRYGNRNFDEANTTTLEKNCGSSPNFEVCSADVPIVNPSVNTANNKLNGTTYDAAGNVITDTKGREFTYDAENKQVAVENGSSQLIGQYYFDGDGKRVKKVVPNGETTIFVYDASGRLIGEYSTEAQPSQDAKTQYLTADHLGTPRINTNSIGAVVSRSDYMPYGEEITIGRSSGQGYVVDDVRQGFTGYENDDETGLDYAQARMYAKSLGRFTGSDPIFINSRRMLDPQQLNLFVYVRNNPLMFVDPTGEDLRIGGNTDKSLDELRKILGTDDAKTRITYDKEKGLTVDLKDIDLSKNEGAKLLNDLVTSKKVYEFSISDTVTTAGGERAVGDMVNLSNNDVRLTADTDKPPAGTDGLVVIDPARDGMLSVTEGSGEKLPVSWTTSFHELAESYAKVDGSKQYAEAHAAANTREDVMREQRPELKAFMRGGGGPNLRLNGDKLKAHRDSVNKRLKKN